MPTKTVHVDLTPCAVGCLEIWFKISLILFPFVLVFLAVLYAVIENGWINGY